MANTGAPTQDGESLIRIADRDRCKPITFKHMRIRVSMYACPNAKTMRRCKPSGVSWQRQRELDPRRGPWQVQPHCMRSHTHALRTQTTTRTGTRIYTSRATQVSMRTMPLNSTHTHTQTSMPAFLSPDAQVYYYHIIMVSLFVIVATRAPACSQVMQLRSV